MWPFNRRTDEDFQREIESHLAIEVERLIGEGLTPDQARRAARLTFGNVTATQERFFESRQVLWLQELRDDIHYAVRAFLRSPGFAAIAVLTLALGIGANTAIFSVLNAVLLRPLPYRDSGSLVLIEQGEVGLTPGWVVPAWRDRATTLVGLGGFSGPRAGAIITRGDPEQIRITDVTWNFLSFLGVAPALGRDFTAGDSRPGSSVAIISDELWRRQFGGDASVVGRTVTISGAATTIVGVLDPAFRFPTAGASALGLPSDMQPNVLRVVADESRYLNVIGRLESGTSTQAATHELLAIFKQASAHEYSRDLLDRVQITLAPLQTRLVGDLGARLWLVMGAVAFVLLVACANVANLLLARASTRQRELAVRAALGAGLGRLARLLLTESMVLAVAGSAGALLFAYATRGIARTLLAGRIPHVGTIGIDWTVLGFTFGIAVATGIVCGLASLPGTRRINLAAMFNAGGSVSATPRSLTRRALLSVETAVTFVLVVGAALLVQTLWNLTTQDRGFDADRLLTVRVTPGLPPGIDRFDRSKAAPKYWAAFFVDLQDRLARIPGVSSVGAVSLGPLEGIGSGFGNVSVNGGPPSGERTLTPVAFVTPQYFQTMQISIVKGRGFDGGDRLGTGLVAIVNETFERRFAPGGNIIGAHVTTGSGPEDFTIIGVARDVPDRSLRQAPEPLLIAPLAQMPGLHLAWGALTFVLRTPDGDPLTLAPDVRRAIWAINPNIVITDVATMSARVAAGMRAERDSALLFGLFAVAALVMAAIGVYGVAAYALAQRTREIGIRVALGAVQRDVSRLVVSHTLWPTAIGIAVGVVGAAVATRLVSSMVYGVTPLDLATFTTSAAVLAGVALAATWLPVRRATRIDPLIALRYE